MSVSTAKKTQWTPTIRTVDAIVPGCRFHVGSGNENFRVTRFGGEPEFIRRMIEAVRPGDVFFDIGTCIGFVAVHAAKAGARVIGFEPEPQLRARAIENGSLNDLDDLRIVDWAVSDGAGDVDLFSDGPHGCSPTLAKTAGRVAVRVPTRSIDSAIADGTLPVPNVVKIDIEGAEVKALRGMTTLLRSPGRPRVLFIEVHPPMIAAVGDAVGDVAAILGAAGYRLAGEAEREGQVHHEWVVG